MSKTNITQATSRISQSVQAQTLTKLVQCLGANRITFLEMTPDVVFEVAGLSRFMVRLDGSVLELLETTKRIEVFHLTARSHWLYGVALEMVRNDAGELVSRDATTV